MDERCGVSSPSAPPSPTAPWQADQAAEALVGVRVGGPASALPRLPLGLHFQKQELPEAWSGKDIYL